MEKHFSPADSADTSFVLSSDCLCDALAPKVLPVFSVDLNQNPTSHLMKMSRGQGTEEEQMVFLAENMQMHVNNNQHLLSAHQQFV